ncbi:MAG: carboxypeptidase-like regulatory domain-containing protein [Candidatus Methanoperedens sp.]|nr:carboxypeptidase-like regulatory domain-containing protein [Candidatus Methanoperedens sp.]
MKKKMAFGLLSTVVAWIPSWYMGKNPQPPPPPTPAPAPVPAPIPTPIPPPTLPAPAPMSAPVPTPVASISAANLTFVVTDNATALPVQNAAVTVDTVKIKTDDDGKAVFANIALGDHRYTVNKRGYKRITGVVRVAGDTTMQVKLVSK